MRRFLVPSIFSEIENPRDLFNVENFFGSSEGNGLSLYETEDKVIVDAAVPGIKSKDIQINFEKGVLTIKAESKEDKENKEPGVKYHIRSNQSFCYRISIPIHVDESKPPEATCKDGVLKIVFHKARISKTHHIEVKEG